MFGQMIIIQHSFFGDSFSKKIPTQSGSTFRPSPWPRLDDGNVVISPSHATQDHDPTAGGTEKRHGTAWFSGDPATLPSRFHGYEMKNAFYGDSTWLDHEIRFITTIVELFDLMLEPYKPTYTAGKHHIELHDFASWRSWSNVQAGVINQFMWKKETHVCL